MSTLNSFPLPTRRSVHRLRRGALRVARRTGIALGVVAALAAFTLTAGAQDPASSGARFELRPVAGGFVPTGDQRDLLDDAGLFGAELGYRLHRNWAVVGSFGWAPSADKLTSSANRVDAFQYDLGVEARLPEAWRAGDRSPFALGLFAGAGLGARSYSYRDRDVGTETNLAGYGAIGADLGPSEGRYSLRLEARDYVSSFKGLQGELPEREARNDLALYAGVGIRF